MPLCNDTHLGVLSRLAPPPSVERRAPLGVYGCSFDQSARVAEREANRGTDIAEAALRQLPRRGPTCGYTMVTGLWGEGRGKDYASLAGSLIMYRSWPARNIPRATTPGTGSNATILPRARGELGGGRRDVEVHARPSI
jgi:hypothetical protein